MGHTAPVLPTTCWVSPLPVASTPWRPNPSAARAAPVGRPAAAAAASRPRPRRAVMSAAPPPPPSAPPPPPSASEEPANGAAAAEPPAPAPHSSLQMTGKGAAWAAYGPNTKVIKGGHRPAEWSTDPLGRSVVNPPVYHASTVTFPTVAALRYAAADWPFTGMWYGRHGNPTTWALEEAFATIEGGDNACVTGSGVAAVNAALLAFLETGDHVLMTDAVYDPSRGFCDKFLGRFGVETTYYSPTASVADVAALFRDNTKVLFVESPASLSFEVMDVPALAAMAHAKGAKVIIDNTWGPMFLQPFDLGVDVSINAATKYIGGHSDLMLGLIATTRECYRAVKSSVAELGCPPGSDDCYLALRGLRTLGVRLRAHEAAGYTLARWLEARPEVARVMHPGLESHPQHALWKAQFSGACGLFGLQLVAGFPQAALDEMLDGMALFSMGFSWGGYESLILQNAINSARSVKYWEYGGGLGQTLRIHAGLEDTADLLADLEAGFARLHAATARIAAEERAAAAEAPTTATASET